MLRGSFRRGDHVMSVETRAYAKLLGMNGLIFYLTEFRTTIGRGPGVDLKVSDDLVISRVHARIEYSPETQAFELIVLGKNGAIVNGEFVGREDQPHALTSQTEITFGKNNPVSLVFLLPCAQHARIHQKPQEKRPRSLLLIVGQILLTSELGRLSLERIVDEITRQYPAYAKSFGSREILRSSVIFTLSCNQHLLKVHSAQDLSTSIHEPDVTLLVNSNRPLPQSMQVPSPQYDAAEFSIEEEHVVRFLGDDLVAQFGNTSHDERTS